MVHKVKDADGKVVAELMQDTDVVDSLDKKTVAIIGYASQGRGQSLCYRDSGIKTILGLREHGASWKRALDDGWVENESLYSISDAVKKADVKTNTNENVTWKDFRSSMACDLLKKKWNTDDIRSRLGHKPSSRMIDKYVNYLCLDSNAPKQKMFYSNVKKLEDDMEKLKQSNKLQNRKVRILEFRF